MNAQKITCAKFAPGDRVLVEYVAGYPYAATLVRYLNGGDSAFVRTDALWPGLSDLVQVPTSCITRGR